MLIRWLLFVLSAAAFSCHAAFLRDDQQLRLTDDSDNDVPGDNPLVFCDDPKDDLLAVDHIDLIPNELKK